MSKDVIPGFERMSVVDITAVPFDFTSNAEGYSDDWRYFSQRVAGVCEYPTTEYVDGLGLYLKERIDHLASVRGEPPRVLEIAAGRGILSYLLNEKLADFGSPTVIHASDGDCDVRSYFHQALPHVRRETYGKSMVRVRPDIVIASWLYADYTRALRAMKVAEYILIGRVGHAGHSAWGIDREGNLLTDPEYARDGYVKRHLSWLQPFQISHQSVEGDMHSSATYAFTRKDLVVGA
ncbi:MAG TPA: hypothetical protein VLF69_04490 [Candidatus Saccharimonadales bacterium]|nr:hypothetical protein [Candidatus Saccharimonadales bacterium]